jgi:hypothetical protein
MSAQQPENDMSNGTQVTYTYRQHYLLGGAVISGTGTVTGETIVGSDRAYIIKPADGSPSVHVRKQGVQAA